MENPMKQVPKQYLAPVQEFLNYVLGNNNYSDAVITGGLVRDLTLGNEPKDTDVLIKTSKSVKEILVIISRINHLHVVEGYGDGQFTNNYKLLLKDLKHDIDYLFIHDHLTIDKVINSFDCSLNKGYALPHLGIIYPPCLDEFTFDMVVGSNDRFERFSDMFINYHKSTKPVRAILDSLGETNDT